MNQAALRHVPGLPTLLVSTMPHAHSVAVVLLVHVGSRDDPPRQHGMVHLLEHMVFKGTRRNPTALGVVAPLDRVGGDLNALTDRECTAFSAQVPAGYLDLAVAGVADLVEGPLLRSEDLARERGVVVEEIAVYEDSPEDFVQELLRRAAWGDHPLAHCELGSEESLGRIRARDLATFLHGHYGVDRMVLSVAGCATLDEVEAAARAVPWPAAIGKAPQRSAPRPRVESLLDDQDTEETHLALGVHAPSLRSEDQPALMLLNNLLGGSMTSRLFHALREERGLVYDVDSDADLLTDSGLWTVATGVRPSNAPEALRVIGHVLARLARGEISADDLDAARGHYLGSSTIALDSPSQLAEWQARSWALAGRLLDLEERRRRVEAVDLASLRALAARLLRPQDLSLAAVGPHKELAPLRRALLGCWE